jgi:hypothetical protein
MTLSVRSPVLMRINHTFSENAAVSQFPCTCGGNHHTVIVYNDECEEIIRLCPIMYWMRWYMLSLYDSKIQKPSVELLQGLLQ